MKILPLLFILTACSASVVEQFPVDHPETDCERALLGKVPQYELAEEPAVLVSAVLECACPSACREACHETFCDLQTAGQRLEPMEGACEACVNTSCHHELMACRGER